MRRFRLMNIDDMADELAEGVQFSDSTVAVRRGMGTVAYPAVEVAEEDQRAWVEWIDQPPERQSERKGLDSLDLDSLVIGYRADRTQGLISLLRCLSDPFITVSAELVTRADLPKGGVCGKCGTDLLTFLDEPAKLCTLDQWEQARTAEPWEYPRHVPGCSKRHYHPDACWPVEG